MVSAKGLARYVARNVGAAAAATRLSPVRKDVRGVKMHLDLTQSIDAKLFYTSEHEPETLALMKSVINPGDNIVDVGANIGYFTPNFARMVGPEGRVVAFEPSDWTYDKLVQNVQLNDFEHVEPVHGGVGRETVRAVDLVLPCGYRLDGKDTATKQQVDIWSIDDYVGDMRVDFIKTDTDGWEPEVIAGAERTIAANKPKIIFELAPDHCASAGNDLNAMFELLSGHGYSFMDERRVVVDPDEAIAGIPPNGSINIFAQA